MDYEKKYKYIDSEKLIAEIEGYENTAIEAYNPLGEDADFWHGKVLAFEDLKTLIISLQQEQPKEICFKCIYYGKDDGCCYYPHGGMQSKINENGVCECTGFYEKEQEQPDKYETALEKAREWMPNVNQGGHAILIDIFPELGEGLDPRYSGRKQEQPGVDLDALVNEAFDKYSSVDGYGQLSVSFNRAELYSFIKKISRKEEMK